ncbi:unnamed protein product [Rotaria sp. Silwood2]|nr:unnamed protein product [Rotaria sp. Silwood2]CAF2554443.1 unnamed protein product [Rotaria sp. Silwood2]CAF2961746.1 unnamed protein product [Rotaria sp. Silwood2]CAF3868021.1 unnamed protein product [Rotaria sp. Silwood2]CAF3915860.1 unnamed protein product [Rotaria sp. Silwood2]
MRVLITLPFFLLIISFKLQQTNGNDCVCECCTSLNCNPTRIGARPLWYCSEATTCTQSHCIDWYINRCPPRNTVGQTRAICVSNTERILPALFIIVGINLILLLIKDKL